MEDFWGKVLAFTAFLLLVAYIIQEYCLNSDRREMTYTEQQAIAPQELQWQHISMFNPAIPVIPGMAVITTNNEVTDLRDNPNDGKCAVCYSPANLRCGPCKSVQYCSGQCQIIHWRKGHKEACRTSSAIATTGVTTQQTPQIHGRKNKQSRLLDDRSDKQSSKLQEDGTTVRQNNPENQRELCSTIHRWGMNLINEAINTEPVKHAWDDASQVKVKAEMDCHGVFTTAIEAKVDVPSLGDETRSQNCANCFAHNTNTRCTRCKTARYCSGKCQIIHWRSGHKELCQSISQSTTAPSRPKSPLILKETKLKGDGTNGNSLYSNKSLEEPRTSATIEETPKNMDDQNSKIIQENSGERTKISGKRYFQTISPVHVVSSNSECNTQSDHNIAAGRHQDRSTTMQVEECISENISLNGTAGNKKPSLNLENTAYVSGELQESIIMEKTGYVSTQETKRLKYQLAKERTKLQELEKIKDKVLEENQALQSMQHDMEKELECLRQLKDEKASKNYDMEFSLLELQEATSNFDKKLKIGDGGYGSVYKGSLHCTKVAIKVLHSKSNQGEREFFQEVEILRKVRHPNIVTLIGGCSQIQALIYEFIPNGGLDSYLGSTSRRKLLSWKIRVQIASDICSALIFLHSTKPHGIAHGDLKPANILLDSNYQGKLSDFGISRQLVKTDDTITPHHLTDQPKGTLAYIDPEYIQTGEMNPQCDVYAFGVILLQLVTGKSATGIYKLVQEALKSKKLNKEIDASANWPSDKAIKMAKLGIRCCNPARKKRPDLANEVWREIESLKPRSTVF